MTDNELSTILDAIEQVATHAGEWESDYIYDRYKNEYRHESEPEDKSGLVEKWFEL